MVYITSDLFGGASTQNRGDATASTYWTAMADSDHAAGLGKRKRHDAEEGPNTSCSHHQRLSPTTRSFIRLQSHNTPSFESNRNSSHSLYSTPPAYTASERRPVKQLKRLIPKATLVKSTSHLMDIETDLPSTHSIPVSDLRPCHACKSAPKRKKDLVSYLDCKRCEGRTCYICARQCYGGCGKAVCKKCIVEVGQEGDPWCLDCYARNINS